MNDNLEEMIQRQAAETEGLRDLMSNAVKATETMSDYGCMLLLAAPDGRRLVSISEQGADVTVVWLDRMLRVHLEVVEKGLEGETMQ